MNWSYSELPIIAHFNDITDFSRYVDVPEDWYVLVADVAGSTEAIRAGRYKEVNLVGVSAIASVINAVRPAQVPFVFGGDGASFCVAFAALDAAKQALASVAAMGRDQFNIRLRIGAVPISTIRAAGHRVMVARHQVSPNYVQAMFTGGGLAYAEALVKDVGAGRPYVISAGNPGAPDCEGLECRWQEIPSPSDETVALLIQAITKDRKTNDALYKEACAAIGESYGADDQNHPVTEKNMRLAFNLRDLYGETAIRTYLQSKTNCWQYAIMLRMKVLLGWILIATGGSLAGTNYRKYKREVVANTDRRKFDDTLRFVLAGTAQQRETLERWLSDRLARGELVYGIHVAKSSLMTCLIGNRETGDHLHFIDASGGGYALAAVDMKKRLLGV